MHEDIAMNTYDNNELVNDSGFDRLVDGELNEQERRQLLSRLDGEPNGWRRCALAFLESQCWKQTLGDTISRGLSAEPSFKTILATRSPWPGRLSTLAAMAASFMLAFWIGSLVQRTGFDQTATPAGSIGNIASTAATRPAIQPAVEPNTGLAGIVSPKQTPSTPWQTVTVSAPAGSAIRVPARERNNIDQQWLRSLPSAVPDDVMQAFNRTGHQIEQHRELVPVPLNDGRRLVVPVDQVDVHYVGGTY